MSTSDVLRDAPPVDASNIAASVIDATKLESQIRTAWAKWDELVSTTVFDGLERLGFEEIRSPSPITKDRPFTASPTPLVTLMIAYLGVVFLGVLFYKLKGGKSATKGVKKGDPMWLRLFVQCHNIFLIFLSVYMCLTSIKEAYLNNYKFWGNAYAVEQVGMANVIHVFYLSKLYEYMDTMVMLLKGNIRQVSVLHVYHHVSISFIWWTIALVAPGGDAWYSCALNSFVHVLMYTYYFLASVIGKDEKKKKKYLWWGRYMTQFQMFQFTTMMLQAYYCQRYSPYTPFLSKLLFWYMITLLVLFVNFYVKKYFGGSGGQSKKKTS
ncbi:hypothetical protein BSKO_10394 [Bryopsis sp. KO-2023]|nr:hypothetical protein BSKO_10394 [Bryopsis sp. KO-2023]